MARRLFGKRSDIDSNQLRGIVGLKTSGWFPGLYFLVGRLREQARSHTGFALSTNPPVGAGLPAMATTRFRISPRDEESTPPTAADSAPVTAPAHGSASLR